MQAKDVNIEDDIKVASNLPSKNYPNRPHRFWRIGWNSNYQYCYTDEDLTLLKQIVSQYNKQFGESRNTFFTTHEDNRIYNLWHCIKPTAIHHDNEQPFNGYTLENKEAKDFKHHPLWTYADSMARRIANWQSSRTKNQNFALMNDPVMLVLNEFKHWFYHDLVDATCKPEILDDIAKRQHLLKNMVHLIPHFGLDRIHLHDIQKSLEEASNIVRTCVVNKELPQLLSDLVVSGKSLETTLGTYLHFLLINEEVPDNFNPEVLEGKLLSCDQSPICKIFKQSALKVEQNMQNSLMLTPYEPLNRFYQLEKVSEQQGSIQAKLRLRENLLDVIRFSPLVNKQDQTNYLESLATVEAMVHVRQTLEHFNHLQTSLGSYLFAANYLDQANQLADHYVKLIEKSNALMRRLILRVDQYHVILLNRKTKDVNNKFFELNLRALETQFMKDGTLLTQLNKMCEKTINSMTKYQRELIKLADSMQSGEAQQKIQHEMQVLYRQMNYLNKLLPGLLDKSYVTIDTNKHLLPLDLFHSNTTFLSPEMMPQQEQSNILATQLTKLGRWDIQFNEINNTPELHYEVLDTEKNIVTLHFQGELLEIKPSEQGNDSIFVFRYGNEEQELGQIELFGKPRFCVSQDKSRHNIVKATGVFESLTISEERLVQETMICESLPPSIFDNAINVVSQSALQGLLRGAALAVSEKITASPGFKRTFMTQFTYAGCLFTFNLVKELVYTNPLDTIAEPLTTFLNALTKATIHTANYTFINLGLTLLTDFIDYAGHSLKQTSWSMCGSLAQYSSQAIRYGFFAWQTFAGKLTTPKQIFETALVTAAGITTGVVTETLSKKGIQALLN
ncbi:MAG: hypothetical protein HYX60_00550 [Legionella longbeachae]|nr:hypothetical protein [Legionella longbeachae]